MTTKHESVLMVYNDKGEPMGMWIHLESIREIVYRSFVGPGFEDFENIVKNTDVKVA